MSSKIVGLLAAPSASVLVMIAASEAPAQAYRPVAPYTQTTVSATEPWGQWMVPSATPIPLASVHPYDPIWIAANAREARERQEAARAQARAPVGDAFCHLDTEADIKAGRRTASPDKLAVLIEASLAADPTGNRPLDRAACHFGGHTAPPAPPSFYLQMIQEDDPGAKLTRVNELPAFLRSLRIEDHPNELYWLACQKFDRTKGWFPVLNCIGTEPFAPGEKVWTDVKTNNVVFKQDCANPIGAPVRQAELCPQVWVALKTEQVMFRPNAVRMEEVPRKVVDNVCPVMVKRPGHVVMESPWGLHDCPDANCDFRETNLYLRQKGWVPPGLNMNNLNKGDFLVSDERNENDWIVIQVTREMVRTNSDVRLILCTERYDSMVSADPVKYYPMLLPINATQDQIAEYNLAVMNYAYRAATYNTHKSCGLAVAWYHFVMTETPEGMRYVAKIYASDEDARRDNAKNRFNEPTELIWHWGDQSAVNDKDYATLAQKQFGKCIVTGFMPGPMAEGQPSVPVTPTAEQRGVPPVLAPRQPAGSL